MATLALLTAIRTGQRRDPEADASQRLPCPGLAAVSTPDDVDDDDRPAGELLVELSHGLDDDALKACARALDTLLKDQERTCRLALTALRAHAGDRADAGDFAASLHLDRLWIGLGDDGKPRIALVGEADWEGEHGIAVVFRRGAVEEAGAEEVAHGIVRSAEEVDEVDEAADDGAADATPPVVLAAQQALDEAPHPYHLPGRLDPSDGLVEEGRHIALEALLDLVPDLLRGRGAERIDATLDGWAELTADAAMRGHLEAGRRHLHRSWPRIRATAGPAAGPEAGDDPGLVALQHACLDRFFAGIQPAVHCLAHDAAVAAAITLHLDGCRARLTMPGRPDPDTAYGRRLLRIAERSREIAAMPELAPLTVWQEARIRRMLG